MQTNTPCYALNITCISYRMTRIRYTQLTCQLQSIMFLRLFLVPVLLCFYTHHKWWIYFHQKQPGRSGKYFLSTKTYWQDWGKRKRYFKKLANKPSFKPILWPLIIQFPFQIGTRSYRPSWSWCTSAVAKWFYSRWLH